ncbi:hypothetical protein KDK_68840 [Dictyobacter kobayashii]|uniref:Thioesterase domain-containing protein n=1 Tax=Dictyobacter kobayashii TaxID=2014872 RepID=A0A402AVH1_9CHLR|nr:hypothetical protein KDK_68840 [Dictyobacter kobayashii]
MLHTPVQQSWIAYRKNQGQRPRLRLFCIAYAGGSASAYRNWHKFLPGVDVCPIQLPGRENRLQEQVFTRLPQLLEPLAKGILPLLDIPFAFFGHSMGALISFELAHFVQSHYGYTPAHLFFSACRAPQLSRTDLPVLHHLNDKEFISGVRRLGECKKRSYKIRK